VSAPFLGNRPGAAPGLPNLPEPPSGWPVGSYAKYEEAQRAVDHLADNDFPVADVTIVGVDLMLVERVIGRLTWGRVLATGAASGAWLGLFVGVVLSLFSPTGSIAAILLGLGMGIVFLASLALAVIVSLLRPARAESNRIVMTGVSFRTTAGFNIAAVLIVGILIALYATWW